MLKSGSGDEAEGGSIRLLGVGYADFATVSIVRRRDRENEAFVCKCV
jgi:hypothetical protein